MSEDDDTASQDDPVEVELVEIIADLDTDDIPANHKWTGVNYIPTPNYFPITIGYNWEINYTQLYPIKK